MYNNYDAEELLKLIDTTDLENISSLFETFAPTLPDRIQSISDISMILEKINLKHGITEFKNSAIKNFFTILDQATQKNDLPYQEKSFISSLLKKEKNDEIIFQLLLNFSELKDRVNFIINYFDNIHHNFIKSFDYLIYFLEKLLDDTGDRLTPDQFKSLFLLCENTRQLIEQNHNRFSEFFASIYTNEIGGFLFLFNKEILEKIALEFYRLKELIQFFIDEEGDDKEECSFLIRQMLNKLFSKVDIKIINNHLKKRENICFIKSALTKKDLKELNKKFKYWLFHEEKKPLPKPILVNCPQKRKVHFSDENTTYFFKKIKFENNTLFSAPLQNAVFINNEEVGINYSVLTSSYSDRNWKQFSSQMSAEISTIINFRRLPDSGKRINAKTVGSNNNQHGFTSILFSTVPTNPQLDNQKEYLAAFFREKIITFIKNTGQPEPTLNFKSENNSPPKMN